MRFLTRRLVVTSYNLSSHWCGPHGGTHAMTRFHYASLRCCGRMATCGACAARGQTSPILSPDLPPGFLDAFRQGLSELGYVEGQNIALEVRSAEGYSQRLAALANYLVELNVDVILAVNTSSAQAAKKASATIPIVMTRIADPVKSGLVRSISKPGGNVTGLSFMPADLVGAFQVAARGPVEALMVIDDVVTTQHSDEILKLAVTHSLAVVSQYRTFAEAGALLAYGPNTTTMYRPAAYYVDRILKGADAGNLPVEQPTKFDLVINLKTANALGVTIPPSLLARADLVIE